MSDFRDYYVKDIWSFSEGTNKVGGTWSRQTILLQPRVTIVLWNYPEVETNLNNIQLTALNLKETTNKKGFKEYHTQKGSYICIKDNDLTIYEFPKPAEEKKNLLPEQLKNQSFQIPVLPTTAQTPIPKLQITFGCPHCGKKISLEGIKE